MKLKSHTEEGIKKAMAEGQQVWALDTGNDGHDDTLIGTLEEVTTDVLEHHELTKLPEHWTLTEVGNKE